MRSVFSGAGACGHSGPPLREARPHQLRLCNLLRAAISLAGRSGARTLDFEWVQRLDMPVTFAATLAVEPTEILPRVEARRLDRSEQVAIVAAQQAWQDAELSTDTVDADRLAALKD